MTETARVGDLLHGMGQALEKAAQSEHSRERYRVLLRGLERFGLVERIKDVNLPDLSDALHDLQACWTCKGECKSSLGVARDRKGNRVYRDAYYDVDRKGVEFYAGAIVVFRVFWCPGPVERKEQIARLYESNREAPGLPLSEPTTAKGSMPW